VVFVVPLALFFVALGFMLLGELGSRPPQGHADFLAQTWKLAGVAYAIVFVSFIIVALGKWDLGWYKGRRVDAFLAVAAVALFVLGVRASLIVRDRGREARMLEGCIVWLRDGDASQRSIAASSLAELGPRAKETLPTLEAALAAETDPEVKEKIIEAISAIRGLPGPEH